MLLQRINRKDPEKVFISCLVEEATPGVAVGDCVAWSVTASAAYPLGVAVKKSLTANITYYCGIVSQAADVDNYCLVQIYGLHTAVKTTGAVVATSVIKCANAGVVTLQAANDDPGVQMGVCLVAPVANVAQCMIRCMG